MNQQITCLPLFASNVFKLHIDYDTSALLQDKSWIYSAKQNYNVPNKNWRILEKYPDIRDILLDKFTEVSKTFMKYSNDYIISTSWLTITDPGEGGQSQHHFHKNSFYSGVYYYDEYEEDTGMLEFMTPLDYHPDFYLEPREYTLHNSSSWKIQPQKNVLVLFPSYLKHKVNEYHGKKPRHSLAMNFVPIGEYGASDSTVNVDWFENR